MFRSKRLITRRARRRPLLVESLEPRCVLAAPVIQLSVPGGESLASPFRIQISEPEQFWLRIDVRDADGDPVSVSASGIPEAEFSANYWGTNTASWSWYTDYSDAGLYSGTIVATDSHGNRTTAPLTLEVRNNWHPDERLTGILSIGSTPAGATPVARGASVPLDLAFRDRYGTPFTLPDVSLQYLFDGQPISPVLTGDFRFAWNTTAVADGTHAMSARFVNGPDLDRLTPRLSQVVVDNVAGPVVGPQRVPLTGFDYNSHQDPPAIDWITFSGQREHAAAHPYPYQPVPAAHALPDPNVLLDASRWFVEPLTQEISGLYDGSPTFYSTHDGHVVTAGFYPQAGATSEEAIDHAQRHDHFDGQRDDNSLCPYSTFVPDPAGPGWVGVDISGRVFRVAPNGAVTTIAGRVTRRDVLPFDYRDENIPIDEVNEHQKSTIGTFADGVIFKKPNDLAFDPRDAQILYIADSGNARIAKIDLHGATPVITTYAGRPGVEGLQDGPASQALFHEPYSLAAALDGTLYVADEENNAIRKITPGGVVSTVVGHGPNAPSVPDEETVWSQRDVWTANAGFDRATINYPQVVRLDSRGNLIVGEHWTQTVRRVDLANQRVEKIADLVGGPGKWIWLDVDTLGNVGPKDDILVSMSTGGAGNTEFWRIAADGSRAGRAIDGGGVSVLHDGLASHLSEAAGHYPWAVAIDDTESRFVTTGFGTSGLVSFRSVLPGDPTQVDLDVYLRGEEIYRTGTAPNFPFGSRPALAAIHGPNGHNRLGNVLNFDDLTALTDPQLAAYIQSGMGGSISRPEITGDDLRALVYFIRRSSLQGVTTQVEPGARSGDTIAPQIRNAIATQISPTSVRVTWQTDEPTLGIVHFGLTDYYSAWSDLETSYTTNHERILSGLIAGQPLHLAIRSKDAAGNQTVSPDMVVGSNNTNRPPVIDPISPRTIDEFTTLSFAVTAIDPDGDSLTFRLDAASAIGARIDAATGIFTWTPDEAAGPVVHNFVVFVGDGQLEASSQFAVTVNEVNQSPRLSPISDKTVFRGNTLTFTAAASDGDLPANQLTFRLASGSPAGATINASTGVFSWKPAATQSLGPYRVTVRVTDNGSPNLSDEKSLTITVAEPKLSLTDVAVNEGNAGTVYASFQVTLSAASSQTVQVRYATANGTARAGSDYRAAAGTLTFRPGETSKTIAVPVIGDRRIEANETFFLNLSSPFNASISRRQGFGTILDDDAVQLGPVAGNAMAPASPYRTELLARTIRSPAITSRSSWEQMVDAALSESGMDDFYPGPQESLPRRRKLAR